MFFTLPEGDVTSSNATEPTTRMLILNLLSLHDFVRFVFPFKHRGNGGHRGNLHFTYLPKISFSFFFVAAGIFFGSVRIAWAKADPHLHLRSRGVAAIVSRTTFVAFSAF